MSPGRATSSRRFVRAACVLASAMLTGCSAPGPSTQAERATPSPAAQTPEQRALRDQVASIEAAKPLMRAFREHQDGDRGSADLEAWFSGDTIQIVHGITRTDDGRGSEYRYYFDGARPIAFHRTDRYPKGERPFYGMPLDSDVLLGPDGAVVYASIRTGRLPVSLPADRRERLLRNWIEEGTLVRDMLARRSREPSAAGKR